jgi:glutamine synthetase
MERNLTPPPEISDDLFAISNEESQSRGIDCLPANLKEALEELKQDAYLMDILGPHVSKAYINGKEKEWDEYRTQVSEWERKKYLGNY